MATKNAAVGSKRKVAPSGKVKTDGKAKKARLDETKVRRQPVEEVESEDGSDSESGGAQLDDDAPRDGQENGASNGKTFDKGMFLIKIEHRFTILTLS